MLLNTMKFTAQFTPKSLIQFVVLTTSFLGFSQVSEAQSIVHSVSGMSGSLYYSIDHPSQRSGSYLYTGSQAYPHVWGTTRATSNIILVQPRQPVTPIIIIPNNTNSAIVVTPPSNRSTVIINTAPARQCGTAIIGSPIPSPIPVDIYGHPCS